MKFLVTDDSKLARTKIRDFIEQMGHEVVAEAADGMEAVMKFREFSPDFVTMDIEMPNLNGIDAAKQILETNPAANIVLISSIVDKKLILSALRFGVRNILQKPLSYEAFAEELGKLIGADSEH